MKANGKDLVRSGGFSTVLPFIIMLLACLFVLASFFLPWFNIYGHDVSGAFLATGRVFDVYGNYPQMPIETFWLLWLVPILTLSMGGLALATRFKLAYVPRSLLLWSILPLIGLALMLLFLHPIVANYHVAFGYWLTVIGLAILLISAWTLRARALAAYEVLTISEPVRRSRRRILFGITAAAGAVVAGGIAFYWWRFARERIPVYARNLGSSAAVLTLAWSPPGKQLAVGGIDGIQVWDALTGDHLQKFIPASTDDPHGNAIDSFVADLAWSPDGKYLAAGLNGFISVWEVATSKEIFTRPNVSSRLAWSPDSQLLAFGNMVSRSLESWNVTTGVHVLDYHSTGKQFVDFRSVAWSHNGNYIALVRNSFDAKHDGALDVWDAHTGDLLFSYDERRFMWSIAWSPDSKRIAYAADEVVILDIATRKPVLTYPPDSLIVAWSPDGGRIASAANGAVLVWDANTGDTLFTYVGHASSTNGITAITWSPDAKYIASSNGYDVQVWQP